MAKKWQENGEKHLQSKRSPSMSRVRNYVFTMNNYPNTNLVDNIRCKYIVYGKEVAPTTGTPHLQGFVSFASPCTLAAAQKKLPGCWVEGARSIDEAIDYAQKDLDWVERGTRPLNQLEKGEAEEKRWTDIRQAAEEGRVEDIPARVRFMNSKLIDYHRDKALQARPLSDSEDQMLWYHGSSGTGKSRKAREENPEAYLKMCNKWWDGYSDEEVVLIEDFDKTHAVLGHHLKIWADRYPFLAEKKGGAFKIRPKLIIVTSNYAPEEIWEDDNTLQPILRRFKLHHFS